tara:strand:+ start:117 stop:374 length:258 start_codon:yes stop_codon:yes gene_type:complete
MKTVDPKKYNLSSRVSLQENSSNELCIVINRKSRIIMKDGYRILEIAEKIKQVENKRKVKVLSSAPFCSKTRVFLNKKGLCLEAL